MRGKAYTVSWMVILAPQRAETLCNVIFFIVSSPSHKVVVADSLVTFIFRGPSEVHRGCCFLPGKGVSSAFLGPIRAPTRRTGLAAIFELGSLASLGVGDKICSPHLVNQGNNRFIGNNKTLGRGTGKGAIVGAMAKKWISLSWARLHCWEYVLEICPRGNNKSG
jgi:hypothetical protein